MKNKNEKRGGACILAHAHELSGDADASWSREQLFPCACACAVYSPKTNEKAHLVLHRELCLEDIASTESDELECRYRQESPDFAKYVSAITLATNLSVTLIIIIVDQ